MTELDSHFNSKQKQSTATIYPTSITSLNLLITRYHLISPIYVHHLFNFFFFTRQNILGYLWRIGATCQCGIILEHNVASWDMGEIPSPATKQKQSKTSRKYAAVGNRGFCIHVYLARRQYHTTGTYRNIYQESWLLINTVVSSKINII